MRWDENTAEVDRGGGGEGGGREEMREVLEEEEEEEEEEERRIRNMEGDVTTAPHERPKR